MREHPTTTVYNTAIKVNKCNFCKGRTIRYGKRHCRKGVYQLYLCKSCNHRFSANTTFKKMKNKAQIITASLDLYYKGLSLRKVCDFIHQQYGVKITHPTVLGWIRKYVKLIKCYTNKLKIKPSDFSADETAFQFRKHSYWAWDILDRKSRFLVALKLTMHRYTSDQNNIFKESLKFVNGQPKIIFTDGYKGYPRMIRNVYPEAKHIVSGLKDKKITMIERFHGSLKERYKVMRGFRVLPTAQVLLDGYRIYYNFLRSNMGLNGLTPAQAAGLNVKNDWLSLIEKAAKVKNNGHK